MQNPQLLCPNCGTQAEPGQRFCAECGALLGQEANKPTELAADSRISQANTVMQDDASSRPVSPAPLSQAQQGMAPTAPMAGAAANGSAGASQTPAPAPTWSTVPMSVSHVYGDTTEGNLVPPPPPETYVSAPRQAVAPGTIGVPDYARAPRRSRGCLITSIVLLLVLALGGFGTYYAYTHYFSGNSRQGPGGSTPGAQQSPGNGGSTPVANGSTPGNTTPGSSNGSPTGSGPTSETLNLAFTYASINYTITSTQYSSSFTDDTSVTTGVRVSFQENNTGSRGNNFLYSDVFRLVMPDGSKVPPGGALHSIAPTAQTTDMNWVDFPVPSAVDVSQLQLQVGTASEQQMLIPLKPGADLSQYQAKSSSPNATFQYNSLTWTITSATRSLSVANTQATNGNVYVTVTLKVVNSTSNDWSGYYGNFIRLKAGGATSQPTSDSTLPTSVPSQSNQTGTVIFLVPQGNTTYTLIMLAQPNASPPVNQVTQDFQIS